VTIMRHLAAGGALAVAATVLAASALAAPPQSPPGQEKKADAAEAPEAGPAVQAANAEEKTPPGQEQKAETKAKAKASKSTGITSTTAGVKPSSTTDKWTSTTAGATPDVSKRYGNGTTATQIATSRGAPGSTEIRGPGNSQPHKVCGKNGHWIDVHAVKAYTATTCAATTQVKVPTPTQITVTSSPLAPATTSGAAVTVTPAGPVAPTGVPGVETQTGAGAASPAGGVAGALGALGTAAGGTLPFTGFPLWAVALAGIAAIATGWALMRRGRPAAPGAV
jgi:hypothetical protein